MKSIIFLLFAISMGRCADDHCKGFLENKGCTCNAVTWEVRCEKATISDSDFNLIGKSIVGNYELLYVTQIASLVTIVAQTFTAQAKFYRIFIENNPDLTTIADGAFFHLIGTKSLFIINNPQLAGNILALLKKSSDSLKYVDFKQNALTKAEQELFNDKNSALIEYIRLDNQTSPTFEVESNAFSSLPVLKQLSLDNKKLILADNSINLSNNGKVTAKGHVEIYLNNSQLAAWRDTIIIPSSNAVIYLDLINNPNIGVTNADVFKSFFDKNKENKVFLEEHATVCTCQVILNYIKDKKINGVVCGDFDECINSY